MLSTQPFATYQWRKDGADIPGATYQSYWASQSGAYSVMVTEGHGCSATSPSHAVTIHPLPQPSISGPSGFCQGGSVPLSTGAFASYQWYRDGSPISGVTGSSVTVSQGGSYTVSVTDGNSCSATSSPFMVTAWPALSPQVYGPSPACAPSYFWTDWTYSTYQWAKDGVPIPGATSGDCHAQGPGGYTVTVTDSNGCSGTSPQFAVSAPPEPAVSGATQVCPGQTTSLSTGVFAAYQWVKDGADIPGATSQGYQASPPGSYGVRVTNSVGCTRTSHPVAVTLPGVSVLGENFDVAVPPGLPSGWVSQTVGWAGYEEPAWSGNSGTRNPEGAAAHSVPNLAYFSSYSANASDSSRLYYGTPLDLSAYQSAHVAFWMYHDTGYPESDDHLQVQVSTDGGTNWSPAGPTVHRYDGSAGWGHHVADLMPYAGMADVLVGFLGTSGYGNDCHIDDVEVGGYAPPQPTVSGPATACQSPGAALSTETFSSYQWRKDGADITGATSRQYTATATGDYAVRVTDASGCEGLSGTFHVSILSSPSPSVSGQPSVCQSQSATLSTSSFISYQWLLDGTAISNATGQSYQASVTGTYTVNVTDGNGCAGTSAGFTFTVNPNPAPTISGPSPACQSATLSTGAYSGYQWYRNGSIVSGAISQSYVAPAAGNYTVRVTDSNGCQGTSSPFTVSANPVPSITGPSSGCPSVALSTGAFTSYQWTLDGADISGATNQTHQAMQSGGYRVRVTNTSGCTGTSAQKTVTILPGPSPEVTGPNSNTCPETAVELSAGSYNSYQWRLNGAAIPGATGATYMAGVTGNYSVTVTDGTGCLGTSADFAVFVDFCPSSEVSPTGAIFPLRIVRDQSSSTGYYVYFQRLDSAEGFSVYEGIIGNWYSHANASGNLCAATVTDLGTGEMRAEITPSSGDHYYLITAFGSGAEGPSGFNSQDQEIPKSQSTCSP